MRYMTRDEPEYWENPPRLDPLVHPEDYFDSESTNPKVLDLLRKVRATYFALGDAEDDDIPLASVVQMPPGYGLPYHTHDCDVVMIVIEGSLYVPGKILGPGDCLVAKADEFYGPEVAGPDGCTRVEFFAQLHGNTGVKYMLPNGEIYQQMGLEGEMAPPKLAKMDVFHELRAQALAADKASDRPT